LGGLGGGGKRKRGRGKRAKGDPTARGIKEKRLIQKKTRPKKESGRPSATEKSLQKEREEKKKQC